MLKALFGCICKYCTNTSNHNFYFTTVRVDLLNKGLINK